MEVQKDEVSEGGEAEDLPSDFFDDFNKDEFMDGLSVIDECWDEGNPAPTQKRDSRPRISVEALDSVKDLRELIGENDDNKSKQTGIKRPHSNTNSKYRWRNPKLQAESPDLDSLIKPGSRRDPSKTNEAIKKDKEVKVQQFLAKSLESSDDLRPPGTELDDYYEEEKKEKNPYSDGEPYQEHTKYYKDQHFQSSQKFRRSPREWHSPRPRRSPRPRHSPRPWHSPHGSPRRYYRNPSPIPYRHRNPNRRYSPVKHFRRKYSPQRRSPLRHSPMRHSPMRHSPPRRSPMRHSPVRRSPMRYSPHRYSPVYHGTRQSQRSRSPQKRLSSRRSRSLSRHRSPPRHDDNFLYPNDSVAPSGYPAANTSYRPEHGQQYAPIVHSEFPAGAPGYSYPQVPAYDGSFPSSYNYGGSQVVQTGLPISMMTPNINPVPASMPNPPSAPPSMVPAPVITAQEKATPYDALAQLVAEGKISREDYLKLTPNKGVASTMDTKTRVMVLTRCNQALSKLDKLFLPNRLMMNNQIIGVNDKCIGPKYCSPLKRQATMEFSFTKGSVSQTQLVESIITTLGLEKIVSKYRNKLPKETKDALVQTTKPQCDVCVIRESIKYQDVGTSTEPHYFTSTVHTQVVEQDLACSKSIFNPSGSIGEGAAISIAHLTPAQLVSQLAARAKTLKQPQEPSAPMNQFNRRPPPNYDYDGRGGHQYHQSYNNYRY